MTTALDDAAFDDDPDAPEGYKSAPAKTQCIIAVAVASVIFFFAQIVLPQFVSFYFMPSMIGGGGAMFQMDIPEVHKTALWQEQLWVPVTRIAGGPNTQTVLKAATVSGEWVKDSSLPLPFSPEFLLADGERLWCVGNGNVAVVESRNVSTSYPVLRLNQPSNPYLHEGRLRIVDRDSQGNWQVLEFNEGEWSPVGRLELPRNITPLPPNPSTVARGAIQDSQRLHLVSNGRQLHALFTDGTAHWFADSLPLAQDDGTTETAVSALAALTPMPDPWTQGDYIHEFTGLLLGDDLAVVVTLGEPLGKQLLVEWIREGKRVPIDSLTLTLSEHFATVSAPSGAAYVVADSFPPGEVRVIPLTVDGFQSSPATQAGSFFAGQLGPFLRMYAILLVLPFVLLAMYVPVLHFAMRVFRAPRYAFAHQTVHLASIGRRAVARGIDTLIYLAPMAAVIVWACLTFDWEQTVQQVTADPLAMLKMIGVTLLGLLTYGVLVVVVIGTLEGVCGWSPGKLICGLRVVRTTLQPIGVLRGLVRQLLLMIDGFFNYLIGGVMVAVMPKQQRLGDLAADSIVVDAASLAESQRPEDRETVSVG